MAYQPVDIGTVANDGTGDPIRDAFDKCNDNFVELYAGLVGLLDFKGSTDCSANPNYPAASKGDFYLVSVAGKIGGASGIVVTAGDSYFALADNAGGNQATVGTSWTVIQGNINFTPVNIAGDTMTGDLIVPDEVYDATNWNDNLEVPTKNAVRDKFESLAGGSFTAASTTEILTGTDSSKGGTPDSIAALWEQGSDVASSGTISIGEGGYFNITGTTTITDIDFATDKAGRKAWVKFAGALTLTHSGSTLILPTGANITTAAGDTACFVSEGSDVVRCVAYNRASGAALLAGGSGTSYEAGPVTPPTTADLATWDNQGTSTATDGTGVMILKPQVDGGLHGRYKTAPSTPYDVYCRVNLHWLSTSGVTTNIFSSAGILLKDTGGDNERLSIGVQMERVSGDEQNLYSIVVSRWSGASPPVFSANPVLKYTGSPWQWVRINNDGTTITVYASMDGKNWLSVGTETLAAYIDGAASYGVFASAASGATEAVALFSYFSTTAPS